MVALTANDFPESGTGWEEKAEQQADFPGPHCPPLTLLLPASWTKEATQQIAPFIPSRSESAGSTFQDRAAVPGLAGVPVLW